MKTNNLLVVVIFLLLTIITGGGYYFWTISHPNPTATNEFVSIPDSPLPSDFEEYTSNLDYVISYPSNFFTPNSVSDTNDVFSHGSNSQDLLSGGQNIIIGRQLTGAKDLTQLYELIKKANQKSSTTIPLDAKFINEQKQTLADGTPYMEFDQSGLISFHHVIFLHNHYLYDFAYKMGNDNKEVAGNFQKMIATIRFIN